MQILDPRRLFYRYLNVHVRHSIRLGTILQDTNILHFYYLCISKHGSFIVTTCL